MSSRGDSGLSGTAHTRGPDDDRPGSSAKPRQTGDKGCSGDGLKVQAASLLEGIAFIRPTRHCKTKCADR